MEKGYKKLLVWQKADELAYQVYLETKSFPKDEIYGITSRKYCFRFISRN